MFTALLKVRINTDQGVTRKAQSTAKTTLTTAVTSKGLNPRTSDRSIFRTSLETFCDRSSIARMIASWPGKIFCCQREPRNTPTCAAMMTIIKIAESVTKVGTPFVGVPKIKTLAACVTRSVTQRAAIILRARAFVVLARY